MNLFSCCVREHNQHQCLDVSVCVSVCQRTNNNEDDASLELNNLSEYWNVLRIQSFFRKMNEEWRWCVWLWGFSSNRWNNRKEATDRDRHKERKLNSESRDATIIVHISDTNRCILAWWCFICRRRRIHQNFSLLGQWEPIWTLLLMSHSRGRTRVDAGSSSESFVHIHVYSGVSVSEHFLSSSLFSDS